MSLSVGEILARRKLEKQSEDYYSPGQYKATAVEDKAVLSYVDSVGRLVIMAAQKQETSPGVDEWVLVKPAHVVSVGLNGAIQAHIFAPSYRFDEKQVNALEDGLKRKKPKKEEE